MELLYKASVPLSESNRHYSFMLSSSDLDLLHFTIHPNTSGVGEFEATVGAQVSMSIENCPLTPSLPEGFEEAKGPGEGVGRSILVEPQ